MPSGYLASYCKPRTVQGTEEEGQEPGAWGPLLALLGGSGRGAVCWDGPRRTERGAARGARPQWTPRQPAIRATQDVLDRLEGLATKLAVFVVLLDRLSTAFGDVGDVSASIGGVRVDGVGNDHNLLDEEHELPSRQAVDAGFGCVESDRAVGVEVVLEDALDNTGDVRLAAAWDVFKDRAGGLEPAKGGAPRQSAGGCV